MNHTTITVLLPKKVIERASALLSHSTIEEGGKFLGNIKRNGHEVIVNVYNYLDSGPYVDNSSSHLYPDGIYQETVFRYLEKNYDQDIEHIGSWHSHHCNGLKELSSGDITGYIQTVNDSRYNLDSFFVMLVTGLKRNGLEIKYFLFSRNKSSYWEIPDSNVIITDDIPKLSKPYFNLLNELEYESLSYRRRVIESHRIYDSIRNSFTQPRQLNFDSIKDTLTKDKSWFEKNFPNFKLYHNKVARKLYWKGLTDDNIEVIYEYPSEAESEPRMAQLKVNFPHPIENTYRSTDFERLDKIKSVINSLKMSKSNLLENKNTRLLKEVLKIEEEE